MVLVLLVADTMTVHATYDDQVLTDSVLSNEGTVEENRTYINPSGSAETAEDLKELNIANNLTITYDDGNGELAGSIRIMLVLTAIALIPILLVMLTSFTRIIIVLSFTRSALNTSQAPPNNVLIAIALFLTFFIMQPIFTQIYDEAIVPFDAGEIEMEEAFELAMDPLREFMFEQADRDDIYTFMDIAGIEWDGEIREDVPNTALIPAFIIGELRKAFVMGFVIYVPFIVIDMVVASVLMSMGMMMLPPTTISMPFKILLFVLADGWNLVIVYLVQTFM
ncbi:MAG: flagellar type III secretion system pore protein FliP [Lachnospiraceae bacterium]|nr:flagellar type III secretion system pore protein FliP [Lachnospiraceae bacterium]